MDKINFFSLRLTREKIELQIMNDVLIFTLRLDIHSRFLYLKRCLQWDFKL